MIENKWDTDVVEQLIEYRNNGLSFGAIAKRLTDEFGFIYTKDAVKNKYRRLKNVIESAESLKEELEIVDNETLQEAEKVAIKLQKQQDINRIERKSWRNIARYQAFFEEYNNKLIELLSNIEPVIIKKHDDVPLEGSVGVFHLSDGHFNEAVDIPYNKFDFDIANKRIMKFVQEAKKYFNAEGIKKIVIAATGDFINSDRRKDEALSMCTTRSKSVFIATRILQHAIIDLAEDYEIVVASVTGNESRIQEELGYTDLVASDNYDSTIFNILMYLFKGQPIKFIIQDVHETVLTINGINILLTHGYSLPKESGLAKTVASIMQRYSNSLNIKIHFVIMGHFHEVNVGDYFARSGSLVGANAYATYSLNIVTARASQNLHIIYKNGAINSIKVDLQDVTGIEGYNIETEKELYLPSSVKEHKSNIYKV